MATKHLNLLKTIRTVILTMLLFQVQLLLAQGWRAAENTFETNWNFTLQIGRTALLSEVNTNFKGSSNDMNNMSDWGVNFQIAKMLVNQLEVGIEFGHSNYKGYKQFSSNVNWLNLHSDFNNDTKSFKPYPIYYDSDFTSMTFFGKYNFVNFSTWSKGYLKLNMYLKLGVGLALPSVEMGYIDQQHYEETGLEHPIYIKGRYPSPNKDVHNFFSPALGLNYQMTERLFFSAETSLQFVGADNLDGIHNFNNQLTPDVPSNLTPEYRIRVYDMTAKFLVGVTYYFNFDTTKTVRERQNPWFRKKYQSYYSKYHNSQGTPVQQNKAKEKK